MNEGADDGSGGGDGGGGAKCAARSLGCGRGGDGWLCPRELQTFQEYGDTGEIWWMQKHKIPLDASVLDIGTGNGVLLVELVGTINIHVVFCIWFEKSILSMELCFGAGSAPS
ncbi:hypothetical protein FD754_015673 [Muntiacus muntjak]|uniref:Uncharacterized protein n=1 Tax=Muntiacus muntjak TaxID=9888 RepID=A0A5N3VRX8_MUNMU|nr:hypothetical protein FD754_015673 [Muntiacus muntjak]